MRHIVDRITKRIKFAVLISNRGAGCWRVERAVMVQLEGPGAARLDNFILDTNAHYEENHVRGITILENTAALAQHDFLLVPKSRSLLLFACSRNFLLHRILSFNFFRSAGQLTFFTDAFDTVILPGEVFPLNSGIPSSPPPGTLFIVP